METISYTDVPQETKPPVYTAAQIYRGDCPAGVFKSTKAKDVGYWVRSDVARFHYNPKTRVINTMGSMLEDSMYTLIPDTQIVFDIHFP